jgi:hypothetical protein
MRIILFSILFTLLSMQVFSRQGSITGTVTDSRTGEPLIGATVVHPVTGQKVFTDFEGNFTLPEVHSGEYKLTIFYISYQEKTLNRIVVAEGSATKVNVKLSREGSRGVTGNYIAVSKLEDNRT